MKLWINIDQHTRFSKRLCQIWWHKPRFDLDINDWIGDGHVASIATTEDITRWIFDKENTGFYMPPWPAQLEIRVTVPRVAERIDPQQKKD